MFWIRSAEAEKDDGHCFERVGAAGGSGGGDG